MTSIPPWAIRQEFTLPDRSARIRSHRPFSRTTNRISLQWRIRNSIMKKSFLRQEVKRYGILTLEDKACGPQSLANLLLKMLHTPYRRRARFLVLSGTRENAAHLVDFLPVKKQKKEIYFFFFSLQQRYKKVTLEWLVKLYRIHQMYFSCDKQKCPVFLKCS